MAKCRIELNSSGIAELLKGQEMQNVLRDCANNIAAKTRGEVEVYVASTRAVAEVSGDNTDNRILKGMRQ